MENVLIWIVLLVFRPNGQEAPIIGIWQSVDDSAYRLKINESRFCELYGAETLRSVNYVRNNFSCNPSYLATSEKGDFLLLRNDDETCFEITGLSDSTLTYRNTETGKLSTFIRKK